MADVVGGHQRSIPAKADEASMRMIMLLDRLKDVRRESPVAASGRRERTAEHSWHVATSVYVLQHLAAEPLDVERAVTLALFHDIPEIFVGDTFVYGSAVKTRQDREQSAMREFSRTPPVDIACGIMDLWEEYEYLRSAEARFVMAVDVILPVVLNHANLEHSSWARHHVAAAQVLSRIERVEHFSPPLAAHARALVDSAISSGFLSTAAAESADGNVP
ncbi:putative hydrolase of HD superfamily [Catenulispora sp. GP43]|uniref:HD domain-containing protein n=1 Tax=Catenulispora sp. GP43 TaxID=3156263 RepID=UPI0035112093